MQERIVELLAKLSDGELTEQLLLVNDDLNNLFLRLAFILLNISKNISYIYKYNILCKIDIADTKKIEKRDVALFLWMVNL